MTDASPKPALSPLKVLALLGAVVLGGVVFWRYQRPMPEPLPPPPVAAPAPAPASPAVDRTPAAKAAVPYHPLDLDRPDALIVTQSLTQLPRDVLGVPVLKELLSEDFVFYYEQTEGRLGVRGALRRIAYEHELDFGDEVLAYILDTPAHLAFWKSQDGKLGHAMLVVERSGLAKALEFLARVALDDTQLKVHAALPLPDGGALPLYSLNFAHERSLFFADWHDRLLIFSDAEMVLERDAAGQEQVRRLLAAPHPEEALRQRFALEGAAEPALKHRIALSANYLSFGYQRFFPVFDAVRFDYADAGWSTSVRLGAPLPEADPLWRAVPTGPALCAAAPVEGEGLTVLIRRLLPEAERADGEAVAKALTPPAAVCWYPDSPLYTPLVVIRATPELNPATLRRLFERAVGSLEAGYLADEPKPAPAPTPDQAEAPKTLRYPPFEVTARPCPGGQIWQREVSAKYGLYPAEQSAQSERMRSTRFFKATLAWCEGVLAFSPDDRLVENLEAVLEKRYPALADGLPTDGPVGLAVYPPVLAELLEREVKRTLPPDQEAVFHQAVADHLTPQLAKLKGFPAYLMGWPAGGAGADGWVSAPWRALGPKG